MFNDEIVKNNNNPSVNATMETNKLTWNSSAMSNVASLGESTNGLFAFNDTVKNSIKYMYLNNNKFSNINALQDFSNIIELQCQCNPNLSNVDGLGDHKSLSILTLQGCKLTSLGRNKTESKEYTGGLTGCSSLSKLSIQSNSSLNSLVGIESCSNSLVCLVANNCNLIDIESLKDHLKVSYLDLASNVNLVNIRYIQCCKALEYVYLDNNELMDNTDVDIAFNGSNSEYGNDALIKKCKNGYANIPKKYWGLFQDTATVLDYSYATLGKYLEMDSIEWIKLKGRTDVTKLKLDEQTHITMKDEADNGTAKYGLNTVLSGLTGMKALSLYKCNNVDSLDFTSNMKSLYELDIRSVSNSLTNLSVLNNSTSLNRLIINNSSIDVSDIQDLMNRFRTETADASSTWYRTNYWFGSGLVVEDGNFPDFSECSKLKSFRGANMEFAVSGGTIDLRGTSIDSYAYLVNCPVKIFLPVSCKNISVDSFLDADLSIDGASQVSITGNHLAQGSIDKLSNKTITNSTLSAGAEYNLSIPNTFVEKFNSIRISATNNVYSATIDVSSLINEKVQNSILNKLYFIDKGKIIGLENIGNLNLNTLQLKNCHVSNVAWISSLTELIDLDLSNNQIADISGLSVLENLTKINLSTNNITDITPLVTAIGSDGRINYTTLDISYNSLSGYTVANNVESLLKLHQAGLQTVTITGNNFTVNEVQDLKNGTATYEGFGEANVIN